MLAGMVARLDGELLSRQWSADLALTGLIFNAVFAQSPRRVLCQKKRLLCRAK